MTFFHIDTDVGTDDGLALVLADRLLDDVIAISTVFGNVSVGQATRNALIFRHLLDRDERWPIYRGAATASDGTLFHARDVHGPDGLGDATSQLDTATIRTVDAAVVPALDQSKAPLIPAEALGRERVTILGLGPATNIPHLVSWYGPSRIEKIVLMAGALFDWGNVSRHAEFNACCDPAALAKVLSLGIPVTLVPLDLCRKVQLSRQTLLNYGKDDPSAVTELLIASHLRYMDFYRSVEGIDGCFPHDAVALLVALAPERFFCLSGSVSVALDGEARGRTRMTVEPGHISVAMGGDLRWVRDILRLGKG
jgi:inosine-uridine nucleoside N-ribohydrolase